MIKFTKKSSLIHQTILSSNKEEKLALRFQSENKIFLKTLL